LFLQIEGASIDKQDHVERPCEQIGETIALDRAIKVALQFARTHPDTLIVVTKVDQSLMTINYGTRVHGQSQDHTGSEVRIAAQGPQAANVVGVTNQTDLFHTIARALGLE